MKKESGRYTRSARLYPAFLVLLPICITLIVILGEKLDVAVMIISSFSFFGAAYLLSIISRSLGKSLEKRLFEIWGGRPSTMLLRHSDPTIDQITKKRYHKLLGKAISIPFPNLQTEKKKSKEADQVYESAIIWLIENTRESGNRNTLLLEENTAYGFHRNLLGLRKLALWMIILAIVLSSLNVTYICISKGWLFQSLTVPILVLITNIVFLTFWLRWVTEEKVRKQAYVYAERLLKCCDNLRKKIAVKNLRLKRHHYK